MTKRKWERLYLTINESGRHIQYADINEDNYVCNVETNDEEAKHIVHCVNNFEPMLEALKELCQAREDIGMDGVRLDLTYVKKAIKNAEEEKT